MTQDNVTPDQGAGQAPEQMPSTGHPPAGGRLPAGLAPAQLWTGAVAGAGAYVVAVLASLVITVLATIGVVVSGSNTGGATLDLPENPFVPADGMPDPWSILFPLAAQLPAAGMLGTFSGSMDASLGMLGSMSVVVSAFAVPLLVTAIMLAALFWAGRLAEGAAVSAAPLQRLAQSVVTGIVFSLLVNLVATLAAVRISAGAQFAFRLDAADFLAVVVAFLAATAMSYAGRSRAVLRPTAPAGSLGSFLGGVARDASRTVAVHLATFLIVAVPVAVIVLGIKGGWAATLSAPLWAPTAGLYLFGMGHVAAFGTRAGASGLGSAAGSETSQFGYAVGSALETLDVPGWVGWLLLLLALVSIVAAGTYWYLRRGAGHAGILDWLILPASFLVAGALVLWLSAVHATVSAGSLAHGTATAGLAWWTPFLMLLWGAGAAVAARFLAPVLAPLLPSPLVAWAQRNPPAPLNRAVATAPQPTTTGETPTDTAETQVKAAGPGAPPVPPRKPLGKKAKRNLILTSAVVGALVVLGIGAGIATSVVRSSHGPDKAVAAYLDALLAGDAEKALSLGDPSIPNNARTLLTNKIYGKATNRIDGYTITKTTVTDKTARVLAELRQNGTKAEQEFTLESRNPGFLDAHWSLQGTKLPTLAVRTTLDSVAVNGVDIALGKTSEPGSTTSLPVFPGTYTVQAPTTSKYLAAEPVTANVGLDAEQSRGAAELAVQPNDAFKQAVQAKVDAQLTSCTAQKTLTPENCPFGYYAFGKTRNVSWRIMQKPTYELGDNYGGDWRLSTVEPGEAEATYERDESWGSNTPKWTTTTNTTTFYLRGDVSLENGEPAVTFSRY